MRICRQYVVLGLLSICLPSESQLQNAFDANKTYPRIAAAEPRSATWAAIDSPLSGDLNANGYTNYEIAAQPSGPFRDVSGSTSPINIIGPSGWRSTVAAGLTPGADYYIRVKFFDPDGIAPLSSAEAAVQVLHIKMPA